MTNKLNSYSFREFISKIWAVLRYILAFFSDRKKRKQAKVDLKKAREFENASEDLQNSYKKIDKKKNKEKKKDIEKRLNNMF